MVGSPSAPAAPGSDLQQVGSIYCLLDVPPKEVKLQTTECAYSLHKSASAILL